MFRYLDLYLIFTYTVIMEYLTERQLEVLSFIRKTIDQRGIAPTLREISDILGCSSTAAGQKHVNLLIKKGYLKREKHQKRGLVVTDLGLVCDPAQEADAAQEESSLSRIPLLGAVAAGSPIESYESKETVSVPPEMLRGGDHYVLKVRGESMIEDGIHDDDMVVVQHRVEAREGDTVVALIGDEVTLKRFYKAPNDTIRLEPANSQMEPIICRGEDVKVQGIVVGLLRRY